MFDAEISLNTLKIEDEVFVQAIIRDISDRKKTETALIESGKKYRSVAENASDIIYTTDGNGYFTYANYAGLELTGYSLEELKERNYIDLVAEGYGKRIKILYFRQAIARQPVTYIEFPFRTKNGSVKWLGQKATLIVENDTITGFHLLARDVTEKKKLEQQVIKTNKKYQDIFDNATVGIYQTTPEGKFLMINPALAKMLGYNSTDEVLKLDIEKDVYYNPADRKEIHNKYLTEGISFSDEILWKKKDKSLIWVQYTINSYRDMDGSRYYEGFVTEVTEKRAAKEKIQNSLKEKEVLLKEIHHRVKNNLQVISSLLNLQTTLHHKDSELFRESMNRIKSMSLIHEMLYQSKNFSHINFRDYIIKFVSYIVRSYADKSNNINIKVLIDDIYLRMDTAIPCGLIINEILSNSIKYAFKGIEAGEIIIEMKSTVDHFFLKISDNGVGMITGDAGKESLGLMIVQSLVQQLEGNMELESVQGTSFTMSFKDI